MEEPLITDQQINKYTGKHFSDCVICGKETNQYYKEIPYCSSHLYDILDDEDDFIDNGERIDGKEMQPDPEMEARLEQIMAKREVSLYDIRAYVADKTSTPAFTISPLDIDIRTRKREIVFARQLCMSVARLATSNSLSVIANDYGHKDHATCIHSVKTINNLYDTDKELRNIIANCMAKFGVYDKFLKLKQ